MTIKNIARKLGLAKKTAKQEAAANARDQKTRFLDAVADDYHGREVDHEAVGDYLATVADPEAELQQAQSDYHKTIEQADLRRQHTLLVDAKQKAWDDLRDLESQSSWKDGLVLHSGPLAQAAMRARIKIDNNPNTATAADYADWRAKLRACEDAHDKIVLLEQEIREIENQLSSLAAMLEEIPARNFDATTIVA